MEVLQVKKGETIAKQRERVKAWYIIREGEVILSYDYVNVVLGLNSIVGIFEEDWYLCNYIAKTDCSLWVFPWNGVNDLRSFFASEPKMRRIYLRSALLQRHQLFVSYADFYNRIQKLHGFIDASYTDLNMWCAKKKLVLNNVFELERLKPLELQHKAENWEISNSNSLIKNYLEEYINLFEKNENLCVASIMEAAAQMRRTMRGLGEMVAHLRYHKDLLLGAPKGDLLRSLAEVEMKLKAKSADTQEVSSRIEELFALAGNLHIYEAEVIANCKEEYKTSIETTVVTDTETVDDLAYILEYAGYEEAERNQLYQEISSYHIISSSDADSEKAYKLRKRIGVLFYEIYERAFFVSMHQDGAVPIVMQMFFNFGYMGAEMLSSEKTDALYALTTHLDLCASENVFTIYRWLELVYKGEKEPSKNEFDLDYPAYLSKQVMDGEISKDEMKKLLNDREEKTRFEIYNMFKVVNRLTYGNITTFCPILSDKEVVSSFEKMLLTADKIHESLDQVRKIDYSVFYRELHLTNYGDVLSHESFMKEILPDVILMPNVGTRSMMWQETASVRNDTPARFILPIFTIADYNELLLEITGRYRWEICRKIQGVHWNDIRDKSLTSEYSDYLQFYRKNRELSADVKEQIKNALARSKNNFREVFVMDYENWIKYESKGGFRLNKYARAIIFTYCPFSRSIREELNKNPMFTDLIRKHEIDEKHTRKRLDGLYLKYTQSGGEVDAMMREHYAFFEN